MLYTQAVSHDIQSKFPHAESDTQCPQQQDRYACELNFSVSCFVLQDGPDGASLAKDVQGTWALQHDAFQGQTILRSMIWPGYQFYYNSTTLCWGAQYCGNGCKNNDLVFML